MNDTVADQRYRFLRACRGERVDRTPVWFMRQAGRSLPEYRALRARHPILEICRTPELTVEATLQPVRRLGVDAAILFSDIVVPLQAMGIELAIVEGKGPVLANPIRSAADVDRVRPLEPDAELVDVIEAVRILVKELDVPLIGFAGAPFTLACYLIEGGPSKNFTRTKAFMYSEPDAWHLLVDRLADGIGAYLRAQLDGGASAVQLFDSWIGALAPDDFVTYAMGAVERIFSGIADLDAPKIYFGVNTGQLLSHMADTGADVVGIDWRTPLDVARARIGGRALQGNLDPAVCLAPWDVVAEHAGDVLRRGGGRGHIFNLGHGVLPDTDPDVLARLVEFVHGWEPDG